MFIIAGDEYAADISEKLKEHAFMATEVGSTGDFLQYGQTGRAQNTDFRFMRRFLYLSRM